MLKQMIVPFWRFRSVQKQLLIFCIFFLSARPVISEVGAPLPEFSTQRNEDWVNSKPLRVQHLKGRVVLLDFWTFACWNCYRSFPWLNTIEAEFHQRPFRVVGIHTPELPQERVVESVKKKILEFNLTHPVMIDNDYTYWKAIGNSAWPTFYLIDKNGVIRKKFVGETHVNSPRANQIRQIIEQLLAE